MAKTFQVSIPDSEKELIAWLEDRMRDNSISPSIVIQEAFRERKREWDAIHSRNPIALLERLAIAKKLQGLTHQWHEQKGIAAEFQEFLQNQPSLLPDKKEVIDSGKIAREEEIET